MSSPLTFHLKILDDLLIEIFTVTYPACRWPVACRKQRRHGESREHVHCRIIAYLLARVHLPQCTHINWHIRISVVYGVRVGVGADDHFVISAHALCPSQENYTDRNRPNFHLPIQYPRVGALAIILKI